MSTNTNTSKSTLTDQQKVAVVNVQKNVLVAAGAGSGKTHVLVERYVELLRTYPEVSVDMIVAVTFTRKAAGEMRNRLKLKFKELADSEPKNSDRWQKCLADIDTAKIGTIHSLCESILKAFPAEASIDPQFEVVDEVTQTELIDESVTRAFSQAVEEGSEEAILLVEMNIDEVRRWCVANLKAGIQFQESYKFMTALDDEALLAHMNRIRAEVQCDLIQELLADESWRQSLDYLAEESADGKLETQRLDVLALCQSLADFSIESDPDKFAKQCADAWRTLASLGEIINLRVGGNKESAKAMKARMKKIRTLASDAVAELPAEIGSDEIETFRYCRYLIGLFERSSAFYEERKRINLVLDYNDLIERTLLLLRGEDEASSSARRHFQERLYAILVDEFQDTNSLQAELVSLLAGAKTRLFLIGDDKQSIYKFQGADVSTFNHWRSLMKADGHSERAAFLEGERLATKLTVSFRSHPEVVAFVNHVFERILKGGGAYRAVFEPLNATRKPAAERSHDNVELVVYPSSDEKAEPLDREAKKRIESLAVADWILSMIDSKAPVVKADGEIERSLGFGDFAILVSKNSDFADVEYGLGLRGIPYSIFAGRGFLSRQEIIDIENLLAFLNNRRDCHSLFGVLRSPLFAVSDDIIHEVGAGRRGTLWQALNENEFSLSGQQGYESLRRAAVLLRGFIKDMADLSLSELIRRIIVKTNYELVLLSGPGGVQKARNLFKLLSIAREHEHLSAGEFARLLSQMREFEIKQSDAPVGTSDSVKIMTIHASKGLEFAAVALPALGSSLVRPGGRLIFHPTYGIALNTNRDDKEDKPAWYSYAQKLDSQMELAERRRLLYVAMTRARDYLGIFIEQEDRKKETFRNWILDALDYDPLEASEEPRENILRGSDGELRFVSRFYQPPQELPTSVIERDLEEGGQSEEFALTGDLSSLFPLMERLEASPAELPEPSNTASRVTPSKHSEEALPANLIGTYFHKLMEAVAPSLIDFPADDLFESVAFELGVMVSHPQKRALLKAEGEKLMKLFFESRLHTMMVMARRRLEEYPYLICGAEDDILSRRPDLILQDENQRWYIIDFKTDDFARSDLEKHLNRHRRQLMTYVRDLKTLTGIEYLPAIYFARHGELCIIGGDDDSGSPRQLNLFAQ